jgi:uncharacterized membrane protein YfcA
MRTMAALTLVGGAAGAWLLHLTSETAFRAIVPWLLLLASLTLTFGTRLRRVLEHTDFKLATGGAAALQFVLGIYGGYFGGAVGLLMMASWVLVSDLPMHRLAPARTLLLTCANAAACVLFTALGLIAWRHAAPVALGGVAGGILGARLGLKLPPVGVRLVTLAITYVTTAIFFLRVY